MSKFVTTRIPVLTKELGLSRSKIIARLKELGHTLEGVVTKDIKALVSDAKEGTKKHVDAVTHKVKVISTEAFLKLLGGAEAVKAATGAVPKEK